MSWISTKEGRKEGREEGREEGGKEGSQRNQGRKSRKEAKEGRRGVGERERETTSAIRAMSKAFSSPCLFSASNSWMRACSSVLGSIRTSTKYSVSKDSAVHNIQAVGIFQYKICSRNVPVQDIQSVKDSSVQNIQ